MTPAARATRSRRSGSPTTPLSYIGWGKTTQLGYGLGLAMGAKLARPEKLCINVWGDAAIGFTGMDFETAVRERIPILSILLNNFSMAIELKVMPVSTERYRSTDISGDYAAMARAFGGYGERVTEPDEIVPAIRRGIEQTRQGTPGAAGVHHQQGGRRLQVQVAVNPRAIRFGSSRLRSENGLKLRRSVHPISNRATTSMSSGATRISAGSPMRRIFGSARRTARRRPKPSRSWRLRLPVGSRRRASGHSRSRRPAIARPWRVSTIHVSRCR